MTHPTALPPKWHGADYAARRISDITNRPPGTVRQVLDAHIDWLVEEAAWRGQQLAEVRALCLGKMQGTTWAAMILGVIGATDA